MTSEGEWPVDYRDLRAVFVNCTLKRSPEVSNTEGLAASSQEIMRRQGVAVDVIRAVDHDIAAGVWPDMTVGARRLARAVRAHPPGRRPRAVHTHLAR